MKVTAKKCDISSEKSSSIIYLHKGKGNPVQKTSKTFNPQLTILLKSLKINVNIMLNGRPRKSIGRSDKLITGRTKKKQSSNGYSATKQTKASGWG